MRIKNGFVFTPETSLEAQFEDMCSVYPDAAPLLAESIRNLHEKLSHGNCIFYEASTDSLCVRRMGDYGRPGIFAVEYLKGCEDDFRDREFILPTAAPLPCTVIHMVNSRQVVEDCRDTHLAEVIENNIAEYTKNNPAPGRYRLLVTRTRVADAGAAVYTMAFVKPLMPFRGPMKKRPEMEPFEVVRYASRGDLGDFIWNYATSNGLELSNLTRSELDNFNKSNHLLKSSDLHRVSFLRDHANIIDIVIGPAVEDHVLIWNGDTEPQLSFTSKGREALVMFGMLCARFDIHTAPTRIITAIGACVGSDATMTFDFKIDGNIITEVTIK